MRLDIIDAIINRSSERDFSNKKVEKEKIEKLISVINSSPTSTNFHDFSVIIVDDIELRQEISMGYNSQKHIYEAPLFFLFCTDSNRTNYALKDYSKKINGLNNLINSIGDAYIAATFAHAAALDLGLSCCYIGSVRNSFQAIKTKLNLDDGLIPILGLCVGYAKNKSLVKPKLNKVYFNSYDKKLVISEIEQYNKTMEEYYSIRSKNNKNSNWTTEIAKVLTSWDLKDIDDFIKKNWDIK